MSRLKRLRSIDTLISELDGVAMNQCSLSEIEMNFITDAQVLLLEVRKQKGLTNKHLSLRIQPIIEFISQFN